MTLKNYPKTRKAAFSPTPASKDVVGEFTNGHFVMPTATPTETTDFSTKNRNRRTTDAMYNKKHTQQERVGPKDPEFAKGKSFSPETSPCKTPTRGTSPQKNEKSTSPSGKRWAGPAFGNAPPPSSLPLPDFSSANMSSQPAPHSDSHAAPHSAPVPVPFASPAYHQVPPLSLSPGHYYSPVAYPPVLHPPPSPYVAYPAASPSLVQLSMDLRMLLNITDPQPILVKAS